jgi:hypothetical protein
MGRKAIILASVVGFMLAGLIAIAAGPQSPESVDLGKYVDKRPKSKFDHKKHVEVIKLECKRCHHTMKEGDTAVQGCNAQGCHVAAAEGKKLGLTGMKNAFHGLCVECHKKEKEAGKKSPTACNDCHVKT